MLCSVLWRALLLALILSSLVGETSCLIVWLSGRSWPLVIDIPFAIGAGSLSSNSELNWESSSEIKWPLDPSVSILKLSNLRSDLTSSKDFLAELWLLSWPERFFEIFLISKRIWGLRPMLPSVYEMFVWPLLRTTLPRDELLVMKEKRRLSGCYLLGAIRAFAVFFLPNSSLITSDGRRFLKPSCSLPSFYSWTVEFDDDEKHEDDLSPMLSLLLFNWV